MEVLQRLKEILKDVAKNMSDFLGRARTIDTEREKILSETQPPSDTEAIAEVKNKISGL